ncbi:MAG TPA: sigma-54 dependent transcriptional regulator [Bryobacteraceae bacterium]|jgi:DNA-binding NtrC family response regulator
MSGDRPIVWVADDDETTQDYLREFLCAEGFAPQCFDSGEPLLRTLAKGETPSLLILDIRMPRVGGLEVLERLEELHRRIPAIALSGVRDVSIAVKAMRLGASDYLLKPLNRLELKISIGQVLGLNLNGDATSVEEQPPATAWDSENKAMVRIKAIGDQVAQADVPVLILGESGVGKEVLSRYIHRQSGRADPFVRVNCAALPSDLLESELFGHERGAFTGASREKPGKIELAGRGTIMFDEIAEMGPQLQAKLLHVLQDGEYSRLGGTVTQRSEARVLAATNKPLHRMVAAGTFREDLYFRLNVITIEIPPLRERREDIRPLAQQFLDKYRDKYTSDILQLPEELAEAFENFSWPGNVRQLENLVRRFLILPDVPQALAELQRAGAPEDLLPARSSSLLHLSAQAAERTELELVLRTLEEVNWNRKRAAGKLNICYKTLLNKLRKWQLVAPGQASRRSPTPTALAARVSPR